MISQHPHSLEAQHVWLQLCQGDSAALNQVAEWYYAALMNYGLKLERDRELVKDLLQELFLELWTRRESLPKPEDIKAYLFAILRNKIYRSYRQQSGYSHEAYPESLGSEELGVESLLIHQETQEEYHLRLTKALESLSPRQREIIFLHYYEGLSHDQIAEIMQLNHQSVYNLLSRSLKELRNAWVVGGVLWVTNALSFPFPEN
ncbi:RNA polymerase sigma factor [Siphonobacter sp. BAB-5405]|uniref:RNA polymerase sigma factor n=1 Tax=Siphonobacter sp. BAB-5405 TaxID=1864825 RepID=UPI000C805812|nr:RNA polymerase sigma factor [Siphonobacter sp. BAB-5405]